MEAVRHIQTVTNGELHLQLPEAFWGKEVEVIILTTAQEATSTPRNSLRGSLKHHAQPERLRLGTALAKLGRHVGLTDDDMVIIEQAQDKTPADSLRLK